MDIREHLLRIAAKEIVTRGVVQFSLSSLAHSASTSKSTVYSHFPSKDELLVELFMRHCSKRVAFGLDLDGTDFSLQEKLVAYFAFAVYANFRSDLGSGVRFLPTNPQLWKRARPESKKSLLRLLKQVHTIPYNYLVEGRLQGMVSASDLDFRHLIIELLSMERGAVIMFSNHGHADLMEDITPVFFAGRFSNIVRSLDWKQQQEVDLEKVSVWINGYLNRQPFYEVESD